MRHRGFRLAHGVPSTSPGGGTPHPQFLCIPSALTLRAVVALVGRARGLGGCGCCRVHQGHSPQLGVPWS